MPGRDVTGEDSMNGRRRPPNGPEKSGVGTGRNVAVALSYDPDNADAPRVVASGKGSIAEQILALAFASGVKVREDADLAEVLAAVDLDSVIPLEAYIAVAEILAYVYRLNNTIPPSAASGGRHAP